MITREQVLEALDEVLDPCSVTLGDPVSIAGLGLVEAIECDDDRVEVRLVLTMPNCVMFLDIASQVRAAVRMIPGVAHVEVTLDHDAQWSEDRLPAKSRRTLELRRAAYRARPGVVPYYERVEVS